MPHMVGGGVEKNLYIIANNFANKIENVYLITASKSFNANFKNIKIINRKNISDPELVILARNFFHHVAAYFSA